MRAIEFYTTPSGEVTIKEQGQPERQLKESDTDFIQSFLEILEEFYPEENLSGPSADQSEQPVTTQPATCRTATRLSRLTDKLGSGTP